jgi:hypothetical protein
MAAAALAEANETLEQLREELEEQTDSYEEKLDDLTAEFEDRIENLENLKDRLESKIETMVDEKANILMQHEALMAETKTAHDAALHAMASNSGDAWEIKYDEDENQYFQNKITEETAWEDPRPLNHEGQMLKTEVADLKKDFTSIKQSFEKSRFMSKALRQEIELLEATLKQERKEKGQYEIKLEQKDQQLHLQKQHEQKLKDQQKEHEKKLKNQHHAKLKQSDSKTLEVRRELSEMRREAKAMMDSLAAEMKDTYLVYASTTPGNRKV